MLLPKELTLIVAATSKMGIGRAGTLPWTGLKKEMAYFARVTKRADEGVSYISSFFRAVSLVFLLFRKDLEVDWKGPWIWIGRLYTDADADSNQRSQIQ